MKINKYVVPSVFILLGFIIYSNVLHGPFLFDDQMYISDSYWIRDITNFLRDFSSTRYVGYFSFALNYHFGGLNTFGYHIVNIVIHIINALLVFYFLKITLNKLTIMGFEYSDSFLNYLAITVSLIFLVHPIQTQAVSYITQRFTSLSTLFYLLSLVFYAKARIKGQRAWDIGQKKKINVYMPLYILSILSAILAMKTKEISFTLPFVILLYEFTFPSLIPARTSLNNNGSRTRTLSSQVLSGERLFYLLPFLMTLCIIPLNLFLAKDSVNLTSTYNIIGDKIRELQLVDIENISPYRYLLTEFRVIITYIRLLIIPMNQILLYDYPLSNSIFEPETLISFLILLSIFSFAIYLFIRSRNTNNAHGLLISFGIAWFFITLSIESSIIPIKDVIFEHRLYLPSIGFIMSSIVTLSYAIHRLQNYYNISLQKYLLTVLGIVVVILSLSTYRRNLLWNDSYLIYLDNVEKLPNSAVAHNALGMEYYKQGRIDEAVEEYKKAITVNPEFILAYSSLGIAYAEHGRLQEAIELYQKSISINPGYAGSYFNLGNAYIELGRVNEAIELYNKAISLEPGYSLAHNNLGTVLDKLGRINEAIEEYKKAIFINPGFESAYNNLASVYIELGRGDDAVELYKEALRLMPDRVIVYNNLGNTYLILGYMQKAIDEYEKAIILKPDYASAYYNLGIAYEKKGLKEEAIKKFKEALKIKADFIEASQAIDRLHIKP